MRHIIRYLPSEHTFFCMACDWSSQSLGEAAEHGVFPGGGP